MGPPESDRVRIVQSLTIARSIASDAIRGNGIKRGGGRRASGDVVECSNKVHLKGVEIGRGNMEAEVEEGQHPELQIDQLCSLQASNFGVIMHGISHIVEIFGCENNSGDQQTVNRQRRRGKRGVRGGCPLDIMVSRQKASG